MLWKAADKLRGSMDASEHKHVVFGLVDIFRRNATIDWDKKEQARASLRRHIRRLLMKYRYPPDKQEGAVLMVMQQAELFAREVVAA